MASEADGTYTHVLVLSLHTFPKFKLSYTLAPCVITIVPDKSNLPPICEDKDSLLVVGRPIYNLPKNVFENVLKFLGILLSSQKKKKSFGHTIYGILWQQKYCSQPTCSGKPESGHSQAGTRGAPRMP